MSKPSPSGPLRPGSPVYGQGRPDIGCKVHHRRCWLHSENGAIAANGEFHTADLVVAAGASLPALVDGAGTDVVAQTSAICVIQLEPHEMQKYKDIPIIDDFDISPRFTSTNLIDPSFLQGRHGHRPQLPHLPVPSTKNLYIATVGSNHGFKFLPVIGSYVADMLEGPAAVDAEPDESSERGKIVLHAPRCHEGM
ncbi:hypothetical protein AK830_g2119 [Neonectria ditissima]|uniref:FAD dependent oxidoreductase domain-containing protein n=1 Tax=Neonectria ditissima TaxID=78410 RepID=A0A0P7BX65_9HYPO|nr:hypothetical protein AK830_g2119 [Neonectria ditissima]